LRTVAGGVYVGDVVGNQLERIALRLQGRACRVVAAVHRGTSRM
jgi:hypothetical protein